MAGNDGLLAGIDESWLQGNWRPMMAWQYFVVCLFDFVVFPILNGAACIYTGAYHEWHPLTLQGGGLYHLAMGGIIGVTSWQRSNEKMTAFSAGSFGGSTSSTSTSTTTTDTVVPSPPPAEKPPPAPSGRAD